MDDKQQFAPMKIVINTVDNENPDYDVEIPVTDYITLDEIVEE